MELLSASIRDIRDAIIEKKISAKEVTQFFLKRSQDLNPKTNAFIQINEEALASAEEIDAKIANGENPGLLAGVPIGIKDLLNKKGMQTTAGSKILKGFQSPYSSTVVERLERQGAVVLGKMNLDEFAMGSSNETSYFGKVVNPWNEEYVPGGSSGGSAAAVAAGMLPATIGTDTGGSIRQPASFCGIFGMKPTYGRVSRYGIVAFASSLDQAGPMTKTAEDSAFVLEAISGFDEKDSTSARKEVPSFTNKLAADAKNFKIGIAKEFFAEGLDSDVQSKVQEALDAWKAAGAELVDIDLPLMKYSVSIYYLICTSEASSNLARYDGVRYGYRANSQNLEDMYCETRGEGFGDEVKRRIMLGTYALSSGYYDAYYLKASQVRRLFLEDYQRAFEKCDLIFSPVTTSPAFKIGDRISDPLQMYLNDIFTTSANLAGLPGASVPIGFSKNGLPIGMQILAPHFEEERIFQAAKITETIFPVEKRIPHVY